MSERRRRWKFPQHRVSLDRSVLKISAPNFGPLADPPDRQSLTVAADRYFKTTPIRFRQEASDRIVRQIRVSGKSPVRKSCAR